MKLQQNQWAKAESGFWLLNHAKKLEKLLFYALIFFLPTQLGKHFWFDFSSVLGVRVDYLSPTVYLTDLFVVGLFLLLLLQRKLPKISPYFSFTILFLSFGIFFSQSPLIGWYGLLKLLELSFVAWYVCHSSFHKDFVALCFCVGILTETSIAFIQTILQHSIGGLLYFFGERAFNATTPGIANASIQGHLFLRPYGTFSHPNMLAGFLLISMLLVVYLFSEKRRIKIVFPTILFTSIGIFLSLSRTVIASGVFAVVVFIAIAIKQKNSRQLLLFLLIILVGALLSFILFPQVILRVLTLSYGESLTERELLANVALQMIVHFPLFGVGLDNFIPALPFFMRNTIVLQPVHNIYLLIASETGIGGLFIFLWFLAILVKKYLTETKKYSGRRHSIFLLLALFIILLIGLLDHYFFTLQQGQLLFAFVIGFILRESHSATIQR